MVSGRGRPRPRALTVLRPVGLGIGVLAAAAGCAGTVTGEPLTAPMRSQTLCVERHPGDKRDLASEIVEELQQSKLKAVAASAGECPEDLPYRVRYIDSWSWDMRRYLAKLTIEVCDASTNEIVAYGESDQPSLAAMGMTHREVVHRAVGALLYRR